MLAPIVWDDTRAAKAPADCRAGMFSVCASCISRSLKLAPANIVAAFRYSIIFWTVIFSSTFPQRDIAHRDDAIGVAAQTRASDVGADWFVRPLGKNSGLFLELMYNSICDLLIQD